MSSRPVADAAMLGDEAQLGVTLVARVGLGRGGQAVRGRLVPHRHTSLLVTIMIYITIVISRCGAHLERGGQAVRVRDRLRRGQDGVAGRDRADMAAGHEFHRGVLVKSLSQSAGPRKGLGPTLRKKQKKRKQGKHGDKGRAPEVDEHADAVHLGDDLHARRELMM